MAAQDWPPRSIMAPSVEPGDGGGAVTAERSVISADSHVVEPPDLWTKHLEPRFRDRSPRVISDEDTDRWVCEGADLPGMVPLIGAARQYGDPRPGGRYDEVMRGGYDPDVRVKDQAGDLHHCDPITYQRVR